MESPDVPSRRRFVRDYSTNGMMSPPSRLSLRSVSSQDRRQSPQGWNVKTRNVEQINVDFEDAPKKDYNQLTPVEEKTYAPSVSTQYTATTSTSTSRLADFFGQEVFQIVLHNPTSAHQLKKFAQSRLCGENLEFLEMIDQYQHALNTVAKTVFDIHREFISVNAPSELNLADDIRMQIDKNLKTLLGKTMPSIESVFVPAQNDIEKLIASDVYPRFVRHQMTTSVTRALATNKDRYAGLGDCFVLTNPNKADNPIVYASDGFVKVTGYERREIIPRNCRFLQTRQTDRESVARIKRSLSPPAECVELLLNERKTGEPFWNLLYTAPLYDATGRLAFFIGGQINVSTTVHNTSDVLRILSYHGEDEGDKPAQPRPEKQPRQSLFSTLRRSKPASTRTPGMENNLLDDLNTMSFEDQKNAFYSAYSKYIVINADTMFISYYSSGIVDLLFSKKGPLHQPEFAGYDIFKFLGYHSQSSLSREYKSRVKSAVKAGQPVTLDLTLCTKRMMGFEHFLTHWTPLKDENNVVTFMVLTMGGLQDARFA